MNLAIFGLVPVSAVEETFTRHNKLAVAIDPENAHGLTGLALAQLMLDRDYQPAVNQLGALCSQYPNQIDILVACNIAMKIFGHSDAALVLLDRNVELDPLSPVVYMQRGGGGWYIRLFLWGG